MSPTDLVQDSSFCVNLENGESVLRKKYFTEYYSQIQLAMELFKGLIIVRIEFDVSFFNPIQDGLFSGLLTDGGGGGGGGGAFWPTMMKLGTVVPYLRKIQKMYKSRATFFDSCRHQHFFTGNQQILPHQEVHI